YVPIDPEYPEERINYMLEDSEAHVVLTEETIREAMTKFPDASPMNRAVPEGRAYMIYTSGSTGRPKGVVQSHRSLRAFVAWRLAKFGITGESVHALHASFSFDASLDDMICPIAAGGTIHILSEDLRRDMGDMRDYFAKHHISMATFSTQIGMTMVNQYPELPLRYLMMGGEKMLPCKKTDIRLINGYGPTEFTVCSSYHVVDQERDADIPIGRPVPNTYSFVCDTYGHLLPQGMAGELCLAGNQIAEGYWKQPELTAKSFVTCPFLPGKKMYRTGDLARYNEAGELEYLGRIDNQVKLRGFRIEMGEIETRASQFAGIAQVAAAVKKDQLVLYYTSAEGAQIDVDELRSFLSETLTEYMVPTVYMLLAAMPMTPNGKIDRKVLPEPEASVALENIPPETEREQKFYELAAGFLGTKAFGVTDNLVSLGLSSIGAMRLAGEIYSACDLRIPVAEILRMPTIRSLAAWSEENAAAGKEQLLPYPKRERYPITENQRGLLIDWEQNRGTTQYNSPAVTVFEGVEGETLVSAVKAALSAHEYLRTRFVYADGDVMQKPMDEEEPEVLLRSLDREPDATFFQSRILPFDLFSDRLYRLEIYT
ncbi:MAG: AMP-binding protein, partial [Selenomonadaceae bacterium]|nr:AMP-binding protein [Selenomonadaceae bacterium]